MNISRIDKNQLNKAQLARHFKTYYNELESMNTSFKLIEKGEFLWIEQIEKSIGKTSVLVTAEKNNEIHGFAYGQIKLGPDYFGNPLIGFVAHFYVTKEARQSGIGRKIYKELHAWFLEKNVRSIELQVVNANQAALKFWHRMGFKDELNQLRQVLG